MENIGGAGVYGRDVLVAAVTCGALGNHHGDDDFGGVLGASAAGVFVHVGAAALVGAEIAVGGGIVSVDRVIERRGNVDFDVCGGGLGNFNFVCGEAGEAVKDGFGVAARAIEGV